jgi:hypothetical protein
MPMFTEAASMGIRVARTLHSRWRRMPPPERNRLQNLANDVRERALDLRGSRQPGADGQALEGASQRLAAAMVTSAQTDPEVSDADVETLRGELARELGRLEAADGKASESPRIPTGDTSGDEPR